LDGAVILVVGLSHRTAPIEVRERFVTDAEALPAVLARLASRSELESAILLSTCNRYEVIAHASSGDGQAAFRAVREEIARQAGISNAGELTQYLYEKSGEQAISHIFRVASSLDSMVVGEPQILGQVKDACDVALAAGTLRGILGRCMNRAFAVAKRVRTETAVGVGSVSISSVAVDLARRVFGELSNRVVLLLGAGEMAESAAQSLGREARGLRICNRSFDRAAALAGDMHASAIPWDELAQELVTADVVIASTASHLPVVTREMVKRAMKARKGRTLLFVDVALPRNVEPEIHQIDNVYVFNVDDLEHEVARGRSARHAEIAAAEKIVAEELAQFLAWTRGLEVQPTVVAIRARTRAVLFAELERSLAGRLKHLPETDRVALTQMMESVLNKLLHAPTRNLKARAAEHQDAAELAAAARLLFDLRETVAPLEQEWETPKALEGEDDERLPH
jgi:glutamyl-tRNA reductase